VDEAGKPTAAANHTKQTKEKNKENIADALPRGGGHFNRFNKNNNSSGGGGSFIFLVLFVFYSPPPTNFS
jgi:hypothetical protein